MFRGRPDLRNSSTSLLSSHSPHHPTSPEDTNHTIFQAILNGQLSFIMTVHSKILLPLRGRGPICSSLRHAPATRPRLCRPGNLLELSVEGTFNESHSSIPAVLHAAISSFITDVATVSSGS